MTYEEMLRAEGATDEDIKLLNTPVARKAFEKQQALVAEAAVERQKAADLVKRNQEWATQVETQNQTYLRERDTALANDAASAARMKKLQELGLIEVAERMDPGSTAAKTNETPAFDASKYVDRDTLMQVAEREGDAIAIAQDIAWEHQQLFGADPAKRLNFRELRREAVSRKIPVESLWMERYGVQSARDAAAAKSKSEHETKIAADAVAKYKSENSATNPLTAIPTISKTPFTGRPISAGQGDNRTQPWQRTDAEREIARVNKVLPALEKQGLLN
jgi:hypothetical protein